MPKLVIDPATATKDIDNWVQKFPASTYTRSDYIWVVESKEAWQQLEDADDGDNVTTKARRLKLDADAAIKEIKDTSKASEEQALIEARVAELRKSLDALAAKRRSMLGRWVIHVNKTSWKKPVDVRPRLASTLTPQNIDGVARRLFDAMREGRPLHGNCLGVRVSTAQDAEKKTHEICLFVADYSSRDQIGRCLRGLQQAQAEYGTPYFQPDIVLHAGITKRSGPHYGPLVKRYTAVDFKGFGDRGGRQTQLNFASSSSSQKRARDEAPRSSQVSIHTIPDSDDDVQVATPPRRKKIAKL